jgi:hypothetical protein
MSSVVFCRGMAMDGKAELLRESGVLRADVSHLKKLPAGFAMLVVVGCSGLSGNHAAGV